MAKHGGVSGHTHNQAQLNHYANQHNPNNSAYRAAHNNHSNQCNPNNARYQGKHCLDKAEFRHESYYVDDD